MSELKSGFPLYGPWLSAARSRRNNKSHHLGARGREPGRKSQPQRDQTRRSWREVMNSASVMEKTESSTCNIYGNKPRHGQEHWRNIYEWSVGPDGEKQRLSTSYRGMHGTTHSPLNRNPEENQLDQAPTVTFRGPSMPFDLNAYPEEEDQQIDTSMSQCRQIRSRLRHGGRHEWPTGRRILPNFAGHGHGSKEGRSFRANNF